MLAQFGIKYFEFIGFSVFRDHHLCQGLPSGEARSSDAARDQKKKGSV